MAFQCCCLHLQQTPVTVTHTRSHYGARIASAVFRVSQPAVVGFVDSELTEERRIFKDEENCDLRKTSRVKQRCCDLHDMFVAFGVLVFVLCCCQ
jgi:hypothetical protein